MAHPSDPQPFAHEPDVRPFEQGLPLPEAPPRADGLPPGGGKNIVPHFYEFSSLVNWASRTYRSNFDEALRHSLVNARAVRRDLIVEDSLKARWIPVAMLGHHLESDNDQDQRYKDAIEKLDGIITQIPRFQALKMSLLEGEFTGRAASQLTYGWDWSTGERRMVVTSHTPLNGDKLVFRYSGEVAILVHGSYPGSVILTDRGRAHLLTPSEREQLVIHEYEQTDADYYEAELAGGIHGKGFRDRIYWWWWLKNQILSWLMDFLERVGAGGFTIYYYEAGSETSLAEVKLAAQQQFRNNTILFPRYKSSNAKVSGPGVERVEASNAGAQLLQALVTEYFDNGVRRYITGGTLAEQTEESGLGTGVAGLKDAGMARVVKYSAVNLADTLNCDLLPVLTKYNCPGINPRSIRLVFDVDKPNTDERITAAQAFYEFGGVLDADDLRSDLGLPKPSPGHAVLQKVPAMTPTAVGATPDGVPMVGQAGPDGQAQQMQSQGPVGQEGQPNQGQPETVT